MDRIVELTLDQHIGVRIPGGQPTQSKRLNPFLSRLEDKSLDAAILPLTVTGTNWVVAYIASDPLVVCMRSDDPLAAAREIQPSELADRLKVFRDPETHPAAHHRLMEMLTEIGIRPEATCLAATPGDIQLMVQSGCGFALIDNKIVLAPNLTTRPIAGARWTADTAFVPHTNADHIALSILLRHLPKIKRSASRKLPVQQLALKSVHWKLLA